MKKLAELVVNVAFACAGTYILAWSASKGWHHAKPE